MEIQNTKVLNQIYSILNHKGYETQNICKDKKVQKLINAMVKNQEITHYYLEKTEKILKKGRKKCQKSNLQH